MLKGLDEYDFDLIIFDTAPYSEIIEPPANFGKSHYETYRIKREVWTNA
jgi:hypothetical protein